MSPPPMHLLTVDPARSFADTIAVAWLDRCGRDPVRCGDGAIILPTRRATRTLADAFLRNFDGPALLLPRLVAIGDAPDALASPTLSPLPPPVDPLARLALLTRLVLARGGRDGAPRTADRAWPLAVELARLLDEAAREAVPLRDALATLAPDALAAHWQVTLDFLRIVTEAWPAILAERGVLDGAEREARALAALAEEWAATPPAGAIWLAGVNAATRSEASLARAIASLPDGLVLLHGLDLDLPDEVWGAIDHVHPQGGFRLLLSRIGARRGDVRPLDAPTGPSVAAAAAGRVALLRRAMLPAVAIAARWRADAGDDGIAGETDGLRLLVAADEQEEAVAVALALRDALENGRARAALVTPDRALAGRVAAELARFGVIADDSAGEPLGDTPQAVLLRLVAATVADGMPPATLLALLKHPLAAFGTDRARCRRDARALERAALRGPRPPPGLGPLRRALDDAPDALARPARALLERVEAALAPLLVPFAADRVAPAALLDALLASAERVADDGTGADASPLWAGEEGEALAGHLAHLHDALGVLGPEPPGSLPGLLDAAAEGIAVNGRRALRGRDATALHPRVAIWGLLEARGQSADFLVLGGLVEAVWPAGAEPGPWMGRPMRAKVGLPSPEQALGIAAHDFATLIAGSPDVVLSRASRRDRAPAVPSRWLSRIEACLRGGGRVASLPHHPAIGWARRLDRPDGLPRPAVPPAPRPPVRYRPRRLSVTEIDTWQRDPYAIYARHVLGLRPLPPLEEDADRALFGRLVHAGLAEIWAAAGRAPDALAVRDALFAALDDAAIRPGLAAWWRPRLARIADFVAATAATLPDPVAVGAERPGRIVLDGPAGPWTLTGRADRLDRRADGIVGVLDYKTGTPPTAKDVAAGWASQLPLEAAMARRGGFGDEFAAGDGSVLAHWKLSGGPVPGDVSVIKGDKAAAAVERAWAGLLSLIAAYDDADMPYLAEPRPGRASRFSPYRDLARVAEWRLDGDDDAPDGASFRP